MRQLLSKDEDKYRQALYQVKMTLAADQARCACGVPFLKRNGLITVEGLDCHHVMYRESRAKALETKLQLLDPRNCRLAHHQCHMDEGWQFQIANMRQLLLRYGREALLDYAKGLDIPDKTLDSHVVYAMNLWSDKFKRFRPAEETPSNVEWVPSSDGSGMMYAVFSYGEERYDPKKSELFNFGVKGGGKT